MFHGYNVCSQSLFSIYLWLVIYIIIIVSLNMHKIAIWLECKFVLVFVSSKLSSPPSSMKFLRLFVINWFSLTFLQQVARLVSVFSVVQTSRTSDINSSSHPIPLGFQCRSKYIIELSNKYLNCAKYNYRYLIIKMHRCFRQTVAWSLDIRLESESAIS